MLNEPNSLVNEVSPYLLQHSYNPVKWYPWGDEAFEIAKRENKLLLISIGYSSCHWCHVMEHESFTDLEVAEMMNSKYVCIKVDREERPDIDQIYMNAVQIITRRGGWPLNCFALPDGKPVYGGTYFPKEQWKNILDSLNETWLRDPQRVIEVAEELEQGIANSEIVYSKADIGSKSPNESLKENIDVIKGTLDYKYGGTKGAPKFPMPGFMKLMLEYSNHSKCSEINNFVRVTLERIAEGGIYDHVGGGFFRYSVDDKWHVPHFEKMLYDNAQLIELYSLAYRVNPNPLYKKVVDATVKFITKKLQSPLGGFYSALDADCNGQEGEYYTWKKEEVDKELGYDSEIFSAAFGITPVGNWENTNVLKRCSTNEQLESIFNIPAKEIEYRLNRSLEKLYDIRNRRVPPLVDDKIITSWNGLMISALVQAYISFGDRNYLDLALLANRYIEDTHFVNGKLNRISCKGKVYTEPLLDDYANYIRALIMLYNATFDKSWIDKANQLLESTIINFYDDNSGMFFYTPTSNRLIARKMELMDGVLPSANAVMAFNLFLLAEINPNESYKKMALQMLANIEEITKNGGVFVYAWTELFLAQSLGVAHIGKVGKNMGDLIEIQKGVIHPYVIYKHIDDEKKSEIQICYGNSCLKPEKEIGAIVNQINQIAI